MADMTTQAHDVRVVPGPEGEPIVEKAQQPDSYEFYNEIRYLSKVARLGLRRSTVPRLIAADCMTGLIQMEYIPGQPANEDTRDLVVGAIQELHDAEHRPAAVTRRGRVEADDFPGYLASTVDAREGQMAANGIFPAPALMDDVRGFILSLDCRGGFGFDQKDLRYRHTIIRPDRPLALIDWEYGNIAHPGQDLAKFAYDRHDRAGRDVYAVNEAMGLPDIIEDTIRLYVKAGGHATYSDEQLYDAVWELYPLAPIERSRSLLSRKPERYRQEVQRDLDLVEEWRELHPAA